MHSGARFRRRHPCCRFSPPSWWWLEHLYSQLASNHWNISPTQTLSLLIHPIIATLIIHVPVIVASPFLSISFSIALFNACALAFSTLRAFFELKAAPGPEVGYKTLDVAVPLAFFLIPAEARCFCTFWRCALRRDLFGTLQLATDGIVCGCVVVYGFELVLMDDRI